jgi:hypothetical protein
VPRRRIPDGQPMSERTRYRRRAAAGLTQPVRRFPWNESFFDDWSDEMAWVLGLIWSDGSLTHNMVEVCSKDPDLIELVVGLVDQERGLRPKNGGRHWRVNLCSPRAAGRLRGLGLTEAKSFTVRWPNELPEQYEGAFVRGLLDGDGSVYLRADRKGQQVDDLRVALNTASPDLAEAFAECLGRWGIAVTTSRSRSVLRVHVNRHDDLRRLHGLMYPHEDVCCLVRKRVLFDVWVDTPRAPSGRHSSTGRAAL